MSRYSSDSDDDFRARKSKQKRHRSISSSSEDSYKAKRSSRRNRKSRSRSRDGTSRQSSRSYHKDRLGSTKGRSYHRRSRSPSYRRRKQRSYSRSRSQSRASSHGKSKAKSKRRYRSRSRSHSRSKRSSSRSYRRNRTRSRSSSYQRKSKHSSLESNNYDSDKESDEAKTIKQATDTKENVKRENKESNPVVIASDDPVIKQQQIDEIDAPSFVMKSFKSSRIENQTVKADTFLNGRLPSNGETQSSTRNHDDTFNANEGLLMLNAKDRKNDTVFHDSVVFEDSEVKIQRWIKKIHKIRQKFLTESSQSAKNEFFM